MSTDRELLRHTVATLAYRSAKVLRDAPDGFGDFGVGETSRTPLQILAHMGDLMAWASSKARGQERWSDARPGSWEEEVDRYFREVAELDAYLASDQPLGQDAGLLFQGPVADALTHTGQIAMMRRLAGAPVKGENYSRADIRAGEVGRDQPPPRREFD